MRAVVYQEPFKVTVEEMPDAKVEALTDAVVRITTRNICGSDLHMYEGRTPAEPGFIFGHENIGIVEEVGPGVSKVQGGDPSAQTVLSRRARRSKGGGGRFTRTRPLPLLASQGGTS